MLASLPIRTRWLLATGTGAAAAAVGSVLLTLAAVTVLFWAAAPHGERTVLEAVRAAGLIWLLAHRVGLGTAAGELTVPPLLITTFVFVAAIRASGWAARAVGAEEPRSLAATMAGFTAGYGGLAGAVALAAGGGTFRPQVWPGLAAPLLIAAAAAAVGATTATARGDRATGALADRATGALADRLSGRLADRLSGRLADRLSGRLADRVAFGLAATVPVVVRSTAVGVLALVGGGAVVVALSVGLHAARSGQLFAAVAGGWVGALGVFAVCTAYVPNAAIWAAAFGAGPGFAVGQQTSVALTGVQLGATPALPLLAALPGSGPAPWPSYGAVAVPVAAGVLMGITAQRRTAGLPIIQAAGCALAAGAAAGVGFAVLAWLSAGGAGGRLSVLGPPPLDTGLAVAGELAVLAPAVLLAVRVVVPRMTQARMG